ncbi:MAG: hypothetical protein J5643_11875 [Lachnospiraceae bacterium]|nr:hypothetical protein [Lachnospiraceae bacterium]
MKEFLQKYLWLVALVVGGIGALLIWFCLPHQSQIDEAWWLIVKFLIYFIAVLGVSFFPNKLKFGYLLTCLPFFPFLMFIIPRASYYGIFGTLGKPEQGEMYTNLYFLLYPGIIMSVAFAYRLGGGKPGQCIKICTTGILMIFSGLLDLSFNTAHGEPLAKTLDYAYHIIILFGRPLTWMEGFFFCLAHFVLIAIIIALPLDKWIEKMGLVKTEEAAAK